MVAVVGVFVVFTLLVLLLLLLILADTTGGVDEPNRDGIDIDEREDVEETGEGIAVTLVVDAATVFVLVVGANKFDIVGECFLLDGVVLTFAAVPLGDVSMGVEAIVCFTFGDDNVVDELELVEGILLFTVDPVEDDDDVFPLGIAAVAFVAWPLFCSDPT